MLIARAKLIVETELQEMIELETLMTLDWDTLYCS